SAESPLFASAATADQTTVGVFRRFGHDIDHPVDGVGTPHGTAGPADHFDPLNILQRIIHGVPIDLGAKWDVESPPVHLNEQLVGTETANRDCPLVRVCS